MAKMNGSLCSTKPMRIGSAANKTTVSPQSYPKSTCFNCDIGYQIHVHVTFYNFVFFFSLIFFCVSIFNLDC
ncbi:hypothetical protein Hanom_Chr17g01541411 [Helianthus anomalus]